MYYKLLYLILVTQILQHTYSIISTNNICTFRTQGKLFSLTYLQKSSPYIIHDKQQTIYFNFCFAFSIKQCSNKGTAFSFVSNNKIQQQQQRKSNNSQQSKDIQQYQGIQTKCQRYSSNSTTQLFYTEYKQQQQQNILQLVLQTQQSTLSPSPSYKLKQTQITIICSNNQDFQIIYHQVQQQTGKLIIQGKSIYGCPIFQIASIWRVFTNNLFIFGIVLFIVGFYLLFYGRSTIDITVFLAVFFISLAIFSGLLTLFVSSNSTSFTLYAAFIILLFISCLLGYLATKLINISIFFIGAFFGFILGILVSTMFTKIFDVYSIWVIIIFVLIFSIPFGLLTFKYHDDIIIASSAFTGAYMIVRPFSWLFGGFPNQFRLYQAVQFRQIKTIPSTFFIYLIFIIVIAIIGSMYQHLKLIRQNQHEQIEINFIQQNIEAPIDAVKVHFDKIIQKFKKQQSKVDQNYHTMQEIK